MPPQRKAPPARRSGGRARWGTINREQIVDAAERAVAARGYDQVTIRSLAADLGVSPMALYHHVRDKDDLVAEVVDRLLGRSWQPGADPADWRAWITEAADRLRRLLVTQPAALHVYLTHPVMAPAAIARMDAAMDVLRRGLAHEPSAQRAYAAIHTYTIGFAALEASRSRWQAPEQDRTPADRSSAGPGAEPRPVSENPGLVERLAAYTTAGQFRQGLQYLLDGIEADARR